MVMFNSLFLKESFEWFWFGSLPKQNSMALFLLKSCLPEGGTVLVKFNPKSFTICSVVLAVVTSGIILNAQTAARADVNNGSSTVAVTGRQKSANKDFSEVPAGPTTDNNSQFNNQRNDTASAKTTLAISGNSNLPAFNPAVSLMSYSRASDGTPYINVGDQDYPRTDAIDVSSYQGSLNEQNYQTMKAAGVKTIVVKLTEGTGYINPDAAGQISNARSAGLGIAAYHFNDFRNATQAVEEANFFANELDHLGLAKNTPVIADMESKYVKRWGVANDLNAFWNTLSYRGYTNHIVYCSIDYDRQYNVSSTVGKQKTWVAQYLFNPSANYLAHQDYGAWQFNSHGRISGYNGDLDLSIDYGGIFRSRDIKQTFHDGHWYVTIDSQPQKNSWQYLYSNLSHSYGWSYYDSDGASVSGDKFINGNWYYFNPGSWQMLQGWHQENGNWYYYNQTSGSEAGQLMNGDQFINGQWYYLDPNHGGAMITGWRYEGANHYYYANNGQMARGWLLLNHQWHFFNGSGAMQTGWQKINGRWYNFDQQTGAAKTGSQRILGMDYYFDPENAWAVSGWLLHNNAWYYYDPVNAWKEWGWQFINGRWYYLDLSQNGAVAVGLRTIDGQEYYLDPHADGTFGAMINGWAKVNGAWYFFAGNGTAEKGWQKINGCWYNFDQQTGAAKTGSQRILGMDYYFDPENAWAVSGWSLRNNSWYYYDPTNAWALSGWQQVDGHQYYFDPATHVMQVGLTTVDGNKYFFNNHADGQFGVMKTGRQTVDGQRHYFDPTSGKILN